ncbi:MAG: NAD(P)-dependent alcohol dehydrogenase [Candidatus Izemoplasmataceae bacterium]
MKAVVYQKQNKHHKLIYKDIDTPIVKDDEVLIKVYSSSINAADYRSMQMRIIPKNKIFGADVAGVVIEIGKNCHTFKPGDEVMGDISGSGFGGFAEYVSVKENSLILKPKNISFIDAATIPLACITAYQSLIKKGKLKAYQNVLIYGAGGGVGNFTVQIAHFLKADVTAFCGPSNLELVKTLGASKVFNYQNKPLKNHTGKYDLILAVNGKQKLTTYKRLLNKNGRLVVVGGALSQLFKTMVLGPFLSIGKKKITFLIGKPNQNDLLYITTLVSQGYIKPVIEKVIPLNQVPVMMDYTRKGHVKGKIVVDILS